MKIELELDEDVLRKEIVKQYAKLLYTNYSGRLYGIDKPAKAVIEEKAKKIIGQEGGRLDKELMRLLRDKEFIKEIVTELIREKTDDFMKNIYDE